jgi:hypothetical protein
VIYPLVRYPLEAIADELRGFGIIAQMVVSFSFASGEMEQSENRCAMDRPESRKVLLAAPILGGPR